MAGLGKQIQQGLVDASKAATVDAARGAADVGKNVTEDVLATGAEKLSGGVAGNDQITVQTGGDDGGQQQQVAAMERERAARQRLAQLQGELRQVVEEKKHQEIQAERVEEETKKAEEVQEEGSRKKRIMDLIGKAKRGGGTGEAARQKN